MGESSYSIDRAVTSVLTPILRSDGFSRSGRSFRRVEGGFIQAVQVQPNRHGGSFAVNLGLHPEGVPDALGAPPNVDNIDPTLCVFRRRLAEVGSDQWWAFDSTRESLDRAMSAAANLYVRVGRKCFAEQVGPDAPLKTIAPDDFEAGRFDLSGFSATKVQMARVVALMGLLAGDLERARAFATIGLNNLGAAHGLRRELESIVAGAWVQPLEA